MTTLQKSLSDLREAIRLGCDAALIDIYLANVVLAAKSEQQAEDLAETQALVAKMLGGHA